jgi:molecular chaperone DnaJ
MTPSQAFKILEVPESISNEDLKKHYKTLARKYHPDVFKENPNKFKEINEAYQLVEDFRKNPEKYQPKMQVPQQGFWNNVVDLGDILFNNDFFRNEEEPPLRAPPINITIDLTFQEAVKGCTKEVSYTRSVKCKPCNGAGSKRVGNGCKHCDGFGRITQQNNGMVFQAQCRKCQGNQVNATKCEACDGKRVINDKRTGNVNVPAGVSNGHILRLHGQGHFIGKSFMQDTYSDANLHVKVEPYKGLSIKQHDVCSEITIPLLEALEGKTLEIETAYGNKEITIQPKTRHSDQIKIPECGVFGTPGMHVLTINVEYPSDISNVIGVLKDAVHS